MEVNRRRWDELARRHGQDGWYDVEAFLAGADTLNDLVDHELERAVGDFAGLDVLHLQCHFGLDTLSLARRSARVTGLDFSPVAIERAKDLAQRAGVEATFVCADVLDPPASFTGRFDLVFASYGVLCWVPSAAAWMRSAARCLRPGGVVVLVDIHPLVTMVDTVDPLVVDFPYGGEQSQRFSCAASYAVNELPVEAQQTVQWPHGLGEVVTAAATAGLVVEGLTEWLDEPRDPRLVRGDDGRYRLPWGDQYLPVTYGLRARKPRRP
jgi:2-polyprenyl-3-methyl-5-hydroxy-6-metoxy-1,4-benzoquinol methylase